ncbi:MAG: NfeD family protein [Spirochaetales bacterium]|nr:NfeD family protein [Spirochaetales bacterium]
MATFIWIMWIAVGVMLIIGEIFTVSFYLCLIGVSCLIAGFFAFFMPLTLAFIPVIIFLISVILLVVFLRPLCLKMLYNRNAPKSGIDSMIGKIVTAESEISSETNGTVKIYSDLWQARTEDGSVIKAGEKAKIIKIDGNTLVVEAVQE